MKRKLGTCYLGYIEHHEGLHTETFLCRNWKPVEAPLPAAEPPALEQVYWVGNISARAELQGEIAALQAQVNSLRDAVRGVEKYVVFYTEREINSPSNHQEFAREAQEALNKFAEALQPLPATMLTIQFENMRDNRNNLQVERDGLLEDNAALQVQVNALRDAMQPIVTALEILDVIGELDDVVDGYLLDKARAALQLSQESVAGCQHLDKAKQ